MTVRTSLSDKICPVARSADVLGDPWTLLILREVFSGNRRFDGIKVELGITDTVLSNRLQRLADAGLLDHALARWGRRHTTSPVPGGGLLLVECVVCGQPSDSADWCVTCAAPLDRDRTGWRRSSEPEALIALARS